MDPNQIIEKADWERTPESVKRLVKRLVDTLRKVVPGES